MLQGNIEIFTAFLKDIGEFLNVGICILIMKPDMWILRNIFPTHLIKLYLQYQFLKLTYQMKF